MAPLVEVVGRSGLMIDGDWVESKDQDPAGLVRLIQLADVGIGEFLDKSARYLTEDTAKRLKCTFLRPGDLLVARMPDPIGRACIFPGSNRPCVTVVDVCVVRPDPRVATSEYLNRAINSTFFQRGVEQHIKGSTRQRISRRNLEQVQIPLPPLDEQKRIAAILDQADALRRLRQRAIDRLNALGQAIFYEMFESDPGVDRVSLSEVCSLVTDGTHYTPTYVEDGIPFLSAKNVTSGIVDWANIKYIPESLHQELEKRVSPRRNDVLLAKNGTTGVAALVDRDEVFDIYVSLALLRPSEQIDPIYLLHAVNSRSCRKQFNGALKGIGVPNLHLKDIRAATIPMPAIKRQRVFAQRIRTAQVSSRAANRAHLEAEALFSSLQHRAFTNQL